MQNLSQLLFPLSWLILPSTLVLAITRQSLWIDEGYTVWFASHGSLSSFFHALIGSKESAGDPQFVLYLLHVWAWVKLFGASELSLRAANIPFAVIFIVTMKWASQRLFWNTNLWILFCLSPFFWFYLNEARPYVALLAFSSVAGVSLLAYLADPDRYRRAAPWFCLVALFLAWGTHILAAFLFPVLVILIAATIAGDRERLVSFGRHWFRPALYCSPAFVVLAGFYGVVSANGVNKTESTPGIANLLFALYEFAGFAGLGPPRNDLRQSQSLAVFSPYWPLLLLAIVVLLAVILSVARGAKGRMNRNVLLSVAAGLVIALVVARCTHFHILGRHLAAFFPFFLMAATLGARRSFPAATPRLAAISFTSLALVWGVSDLRLVLMRQYEKDSYREACSVALDRARQQGAVIIWAADPLTARYYGLEVSGADLGVGLSADGTPIAPSAGTAIDARTLDIEEVVAHLEASSAPTILVLSKPDPFDRGGMWRSLVDQYHPAEIVRLNAITVFEWQPKAPIPLSPLSSSASAFLPETAGTPETQIADDRGPRNSSPRRFRTPPLVSLDLNP